LPFGPEHEFAAELAGLFEEFGPGNAFFQYELGNAVPVAQVDPEDAAFVANGLNPAAKRNRLPGVLQS
jgi:hypothetical protein